MDVTVYSGWIAAIPFDLAAKLADEDA